MAPEFFSKVWDEHQTDDTWNAWVCIEDDGKAKVVGFIVLQVFVHDSTYFAWCAYFPAVPASMRSSMLVFFELTSLAAGQTQGPTAQQARSQARPSDRRHQQRR